MVAGVGDVLSSPLLVTNHPAKTGAGAGPPGSSLFPSPLNGIVPNSQLVRENS